MRHYLEIENKKIIINELFETLHLNIKKIPLNELALFYGKLLDMKKFCLFSSFNFHAVVQLDSFAL